MKRDRAFLLLRLGVVFALLYPPIDALFHPLAWIGYFPPFMRGIVPDAVLLNGFGLVEAAIALWILFGRRITAPSYAAAALFVVIVLFTLPEFQIVFRDLSIAAAALALALYPSGEARREVQ